MPIFEKTLRDAASRQRIQKSASFNEAVAAQKATAFLCHSHKDKELAEGLQTLLNENGWDVYVDWQDEEMPSSPTAETANRVKENVVRCSWFLYLATANSSNSKWCPWEIGFADAKKPNDHVVIVSVASGSTTYGQEYLGLYRRLSQVEAGGFAVFRPGSSSGTNIRVLRG